MIIESKNDYLITVKANQIKLFNRLKDLAKVEEPISRYQEIDKSHGRQIKRKISVFKAEKIKHKNYPHIQSFIKVERTGLRGNKKSEETLYYISSKVLPSKKFAAKIRGHWLIENQVHWVKDVIFNEDKSKIRELQAARNLSLLYTIIMNVYRSFGFDSIKQGIYWLGNNWEKILACST